MSVMPLLSINLKSYGQHGSIVRLRVLMLP